MLSRVRALTGAGIPVMGHIGLTPQTATMLGGFKAQGRTADEGGPACYDDALALQAAGCFSLVLEAVPVAGRGAHHRGARHPDDRHRRRRRLRRPGARLARPARALRGPRAALREAVRGPRTDDLATRSSSTRADVRDGTFPEEQHTYSITEDELALFEDALAERQSDAERAAPARPAATSASARAAAARAHVQPCTARTPTTSSTAAHSEERELDQRRRASPPPPVVLPAGCGTSRRRTARASPARGRARARPARAANAST